MVIEVMAPFVRAQSRRWFLSVKSGRCVVLTPGDAWKTSLGSWGDTQRLRVLFLGLSPLPHVGGQEVIWEAAGWLSGSRQS